MYANGINGQADGFAITAEYAVLIMKNIGKQTALNITLLITGKMNQKNLGIYIKHENLRSNIGTMGMKILKPIILYGYQI